MALALAKVDSSIRPLLSIINYVVREEEIVKMVLREVDKKADPLAFGFCSSESAVLASINLVICVLGNLTLFAEKKR